MVFTPAMCIVSSVQSHPLFVTKFSHVAVYTILISVGVAFSH